MNKSHGRLSIIHDALVGKFEGNTTPPKKDGFISNKKKFFIVVIIIITIIVVLLLTNKLVLLNNNGKLDILIKNEELEKFYNSKTTFKDGSYYSKFLRINLNIQDDFTGVEEKGVITIKSEQHGGEIIITSDNQYYGSLQDAINNIEINNEKNVKLTTIEDVQNIYGYIGKKYYINAVNLHLIQYFILADNKIYSFSTENIFLDKYVQDLALTFQASSKPLNLNLSITSMENRPQANVFEISNFAVDLRMLQCEITYHASSAPIEYGVIEGSLISVGPTLDTYATVLSGDKTLKSCSKYIVMAEISDHYLDDIKPDTLSIYSRKKDGNGWVKEETYIDTKNKVASAIVDGFDDYGLLGEIKDGVPDTRRTYDFEKILQERFNVYINKEVGFAINYPPEAEANSWDADMVINRYGPSYKDDVYAAVNFSMIAQPPGAYELYDGAEYTVIYFKNTNNKTVEEFVKPLLDYDPKYGTGTKLDGEIYVDGVKGVKLSYCCYANGSTMYLFPVKNKQYIIEINITPYGKDGNSYDKIGDRMIQSLKFSPDVIIQLDSTKNLKSFSRKGITFNYPERYKIDQDKDTGYISIYSPSDASDKDVEEVQGNELNLEIVIEPATKTETLDTLFKETEANIKKKGVILDKKDLFINGIPAKYLKTNLLEEYILLAKDKKIFIMNYSANTNIQEEFDRILKTFKVEW